MTTCQSQQLSYRDLDIPRRSDIKLARLLAAGCREHDLFCNPRALDKLRRQHRWQGHQDNFLRLARVDQAELDTWRHRMRDHLALRILRRAKALRCNTSR